MHTLFLLYHKKIFVSSVSQILHNSIDKKKYPALRRDMYVNSRTFLVVQVVKTDMALTARADFYITDNMRLGCSGLEALAHKVGIIRRAVA